MSLLYKSNRAFWISFLDQNIGTLAGFGFGLSIGREPIVSLVMFLAAFALWLFRVRAYAKYVEGYPIPEAQLRLCIAFTNPDGTVAGELKQIIPLKDGKEE